MRSRLAHALFGDESDSHSVGHYEIERRIGAGGMGVVYAAIDHRLGRSVALKLLRHRVMSLGHKERLIDEARALAKLSHPNVVQVYEVGEHEGDVFIAMELIRGLTLWDWQERGQRSWTELLRRYRDAGAGLAAAHEVGIIHRDFKPTNVLVGDDGRVRVVDFGLAIEREFEPRETPALAPEFTDPSAPRVAGTPGYIAPELLRGSVPDERSDQFSFCVALLEGLTGRRLGEGHGLVDRYRLRPRWLRRALRRGLDPEPRRRWSSMAELLGMLDFEARRRRGRAAALVVGGLGLGLSSAALLGGDEAPTCVDPGPRFDAIWHVDRRRELERRFEAVGPWTEPLFEQLEDRLGEDRARWISTSLSLCEASRGREPGSMAGHGRAAACLDRHLYSLEELLRALEVADAERLAKLDGQLEALGDPRDCRSLTTRPQAREPQTAAIERDMDSARMALAGGDSTAADALVSRAVSLARETEDEVALAEALHLQARVQRSRSEWNAAEQAALEAALAANRGGEVQMAFEAGLTLVELATLRDRVDDAEFWYTRAAETQARLDEPDAAMPTLLASRARIHRARAEYEQALPQLEQALELGRGLGWDHAALDSLELEHTNLLAEAGRTEAAIERYQGLRARRVERLGPDHPAVALIDYDLGFTQLDAGRVEEAIASLERALYVQRGVYGESSARLLPTLIKLSEANYVRGDHEAVERLAREADALERRHLEPGDPGWLDASALRRAARAAQHDYEGLIELDEQLLETRGETMSAPVRAAALHELAWARCRVGRLEQAALALNEAQRLGEGLTLVYVGLTRAELALRTGELERGRALLSELGPQLARVGDPAGEAEYVWLQAKAAAFDDPEAAAELARRALELYEPFGAPPDIHAALTQLSGPGDDQIHD